MSDPIIIADKLTKAYGTTIAVDHLDLAIERGEVFGLLGPNGAGKTTTILMLLGLTEPTSGRATVAGFDPLRQPLKVKARVGYMPDQVGFYDNLSGVVNLRYTARLGGIAAREIDGRIDAALKRVGLTEAGHKAVKTYSRGMRQRLAIAEILMKQAEVAILDEPTGGLDPIAHTEIRDLILQFRNEGRTVFISSHELSEVERICDRVAIINKGVIEQQGKLDDLLRGGRMEVIADGVSKELADSFKGEDVVISHHNNRVILDMPENNDVNAVLDSLRSKKATVVSVIPRRRRLEDLFVETVGRADSRAKGGKPAAGAEVA